MVDLDASTFYLNLLLLSVIAAFAYNATASAGIRQGILTLLGMALTWYIGPRFLLFYCIYWFATWLLQALVVRTRDGRFATPVMFLAVLVLLAPMLFWKIDVARFTDLLHSRLQILLYYISAPIAQIDAHKSVLLPVGLSYATFRALDLIMQTYLGTIDRPGVQHYLSYAFCPFIIPYGPIATIQEVEVSRNITSDDVKYGLWRLFSGFGKIYVIAATLQPYGNVFYAVDKPIYQILIAMYVFAVYFYVNFSGYSDLAVGSARLFAIRLPENFNWPLWRRNPRQFWANWHASLSRFAQKYIFTSLGGFRPARRNFALLCTMLVIVWWHELNASWTLFGIYHGAGLMAHNLWTENKPAWILGYEDHPLVDAFCRFLLFSFVALGFPIISLPISRVPEFYMRLLGVGP